MPTPNEPIRINFNPYPKQREVLESDARFRVVAAGRRSGKTIMAAFETVRRALEGSSGWRGYWVGAEHQHAKTAYRLIDKVLPDRIVERRNQSPPRTIDLVDDRTIEFHTAGGGALVSVGLDWVVADEAGKDFPERSWTQELRPALSDRDGEAMFISTPDGRGWFYQAWERGQMEDHPDWASWRWSSYANPHVDDSEIDAAKQEIPDRIFEQEYLAKFKDESGGVFENLDRNLFTTAYSLPPDGIAPLPETGSIRPKQVYGVPPFSTGVDLARHQDFRVILTLDRLGRVVYFDREQGEAWSQIERKVRDVYERYPGIVSIDASRDNKLVADLEASGMKLRPVKFSTSRKTSLIENLIARIEGRELSSPEIDILRTELEIFEYDISRAGNIRYHAPEGFHDDTVDTLALAADGLNEVARQGVSTTVTMGEDSYQGPGDGVVDVAKEMDRQLRQAKQGWK